MMGPEFVFEKIYSGGINLCVHNFQDFLESPQLETYPS